MQTYTWHLKNGINRTPEFEKKGLAQFAVNGGLKCGHGCMYCSTGAMIRTHGAFKAFGGSPFDNTYVIVDPTTPDRIEKDAYRIQKRGLIQLSTIVDAWSPEAQEQGLGRKCLKAILSQPGWTVRILTKNVAVREDFDLIEKYRDRVLVGISITATEANEHLIKVIEPNASSIKERMEAMKEAHQLGLRTYGMFCPILPGIADSPEQMNELIQFAIRCGVEEIFSEAVNPRGQGLILTQEALELNGFVKEAKAIEAIRKRENWSKYVKHLIQNVQQAVRKYSDIKKLRFLLYPKNLMPEDLEEIRKDDAGVIWL